MTGISKSTLQRIKKKYIAGKYDCYDDSEML